MRITIVTGFFLPVPPVRGGSTEKVWHRLAHEFAAVGHDVTFVSRLCLGLPPHEVRDGIKHIRLLGTDHSSHLTKNLFHDTVWGVRVARKLPRSDIVVCNTVTLPIWLRRVKPSAGRVVAVVARMPKGHGRVYGNVDLLLSLSSAVTNKLRAENPRLAQRIAAFPFPIDWRLHARAAAERWNDRQAPNFSSGPLTIGYVGRIHPEKGLELLLNAAARLAKRADLPPWRIELIGPTEIAEGGGGTDYGQSLQARYGPVLGGRLRMSGPEFDPAQLATRYAGIDIFCYPSVAENGETFGVAVAEAMAARCATVVSALTCFQELMRPGNTGFVFDHTGPNSSEQLTDVLTRLLLVPDLRTRTGLCAQEHARQYDYAESARRVLAEFAACLGPRYI